MRSPPDCRVMCRGKKSGRPLPSMMLVGHRSTLEKLGAVLARRGDGICPTAGAFLQPLEVVLKSFGERGFSNVACPVPGRDASVCSSVGGCCVLGAEISDASHSLLEQLHTCRGVVKAGAV